ncbi:MAG: hypothetical protein ACE5JA_09010 [bacterium]
MSVLRGLAEAPYYARHSAKSVIVRRERPKFFTIKGILGSPDIQNVKM